MPLVRALSLGALISALLQLFIPVNLNQRQVYCLMILGTAALLPALLYWFGVLPLTSQILYTVGHAFITYILPSVSGICIEFGISSEKNWYEVTESEKAESTKCAFCYRYCWVRILRWSECRDSFAFSPSEKIIVSMRSSPHRATVYRTVASKFSNLDTEKLKPKEQMLFRF